MRIAAAKKAPRVIDPQQEAHKRDTANIKAALVDRRPTKGESPASKVAGKSGEVVIEIHDDSDLTLKK